MPLSGPTATLSGAAASVADAIAGTDTSKYMTPAASAQAALNAVITRPVKPILVSDGATSNRRGEATFGPHAAGGLPMTIPFEFDVPSANPSAVAYIFDFTPTQGNPGDAWSQRMTLATDGTIQLRQVGATTSDYRLLTLANGRASYSGLRVRGAVVYESANTTTNPRIYINGVDLSASFTLSTVGTAPNWLPTSLGTTYFQTGFTWTSGAFVPHAPILGAWTEAEAMTWIRTGRFPLWWELGTGSAVKQTSGTLTIGRRYLIADAGGTFTGVGAANDDVGTVFTATGTTPTWGTGSVQPLGPLAKWVIQPPGVTCSDSGDNRVPLLLTSGITACGEKAQRIGFSSAPMTADGFILADQVIVPSGYKLVAVTAQQSGTSTAALTLRETSSGGTTVASGNLSSSTTEVELTVANALLAGGKKLHASGITAAGVTVQFYFEFARSR